MMIDDEDIEDDLVVIVYCPTLVSLCICTGVIIEDMFSCFSVLFISVTGY